MVSVVYIEEAIRDHPRVERIRYRLGQVDTVWCERYTEVFNPKAQNFRVQKANPALILAKKNAGFVMQAPPSYSLGGDENFYFSHMLNCIYDCRYCFLQGMFRSAHYLLFVNYEDFAEAIGSTLNKYEQNNSSVWFFSGYDCDSLAYEPVTRFAAYFLPFFARHPNAYLELRTKSTQIRSLLEQPALPNVIVAFSFTPQAISAALEHKVSDVSVRLSAAKRVQAAGWRIGLRFDPLIYVRDFKQQYSELIRGIATSIDSKRIHSISLGSFRMPKDFFKTIVQLYPEEALYAGPMQVNDEGLMTYADDIREEMLGFVTDLLLKWFPQASFYDHNRPIL